MAQFTFVVLTNPVDGRDAEFNDWYTNKHVDDVLALGPFVSAQRFRLAATESNQGSPYAYMSLYQVDADSADEAHKALMAAVNTEAMPMSDALDMNRIAAWYYEPITELRSGS